MKTLTEIQTHLKAPKGQENKFGNYRYRSCEDILEALKPLLAQHTAAVTITDEIVMVGDRVYVKATATLHTPDGSVSVNAFAREPLSRKGMDEAQVTGATSSYARKYALNGLFAIDDTKDADATNDHGRKSDPAMKHTEKPAFDKPDPEVADDYAFKLVAAFEAEDDVAGQQLAGELDNGMKLAVWELLKDHSKVRAWIKRITAKAA